MFTGNTKCDSFFHYILSLQYYLVLIKPDQAMIADTENNLQKAAHKLNQLISEYGLTTW
jgi:hypothetical protein